MMRPPLYEQALLSFLKARINPEFEKKIKMILEMLQYTLLKSEVERGWCTKSKYSTAVAYLLLF